MDTDIVFQVRDVKTGNIIGIRGRDTLLVPLNGQVEDFVKNCNALYNYDMGMVAELYDDENKKVDRFVIFYAFKERVDSSDMNMKAYSVLEEKLTNLDVLELIHCSNAKKES